MSHQENTQFTGDKLTFDLQSARSYDAEGRLHVAISNISKANVCPYRGDEIPDYALMGLDAAKVYQLLRDPLELEKGAASCNGIQLLSLHVAVSADAPQKKVIAGTTGTNAVFQFPYLKNSLIIWDAEDIRNIENNSVRELSCGYRYTPDMTPGTFEGTAYDGIMRTIIFNHVALVREGRCGSDVMVNDGLLNKKEQEMSTMLDESKNNNLPDDKLDQGQDQDQDGDQERSEAGLEGEAVAEASPPALAATLEKVMSLLKTCLLQQESTQKNTQEGAMDKMTDKVMEDKVMKDKLLPEKAAMDVAIRLACDKAAREAEARTVTRLRAIAEAEELTRPYVGKLTAMDSAQGVYKAALDVLRVDTHEVHPSAYKAVLMAQPKPGENMRPVVVRDSALSPDMYDLFPDLMRLK